MEDRQRRYVVGIDGSSEGSEALRWASRLVAVLGGELVVVHALGLLERLGGSLVAADAHRDQIAKMARRDWCASLRAGATPFRLVLRDGSPIDVLPAIALEEHAELVVVGSRGIGAAPVMALGSTSLHLLQRSPVPVLVVPSGETRRSHMGLQRLLVAIDGDTRSDAALGIVARLASGFGSRVELVYAVDDVPVFPLGPSTRVSVAGEADAPAVARSLLEPVRRRFEDVGIPAHIRVRRGRAVEVVRSAAAATDADLVVLASSHVGDAGGSLLGDSVSRRVASVLHRPVLVVPAAGSPSARGLTAEVS